MCDRSLFCLFLFGAGVKGKKKETLKNDFFWLGFFASSPLSQQKKKGEEKEERHQKKKLRASERSLSLSFFPAGFSTLLLVARELETRQRHDGGGEFLFFCFIKKARARKRERGWDQLQAAPVFLFVLHRSLCFFKTKGPRLSRVQLPLSML